MSDFAEVSERITRDALEDALRGLQGDINSSAPSLLVKAAYAAGAAAATLIGLAYIAGRRVGRKRSTIVEVRRL